MKERIECGNCGHGLFVSSTEKHILVFRCVNCQIKQKGENFIQLVKMKWKNIFSEAKDDDSIPVPPAIDIDLSVPTVVAENDVRTFDSGATRDTLGSKLDYEAFLSPRALRCYAEYMHSHRVQSDGTMRDGDNWQKGIPIPQYMKSLYRHVQDAHAVHRDVPTFDANDGHKFNIEELLCAILFNAFGYLHEHLKKEREEK